MPTVIGPFGVFDARLTLSTPLFDARAIGGVRAGKALVKAGRADLRDVRETIVLAVGTLYLQAQADAARVESARAEVTTAEALVGLANDQKAAGIVAGIDVLRQQVQLQSARARLIAAENVFEKRKLSLARAIGLPGGQAFTLASRTTFHAAPPITLDQAVAEASAAREDVKAAQARVDAARYTRQAEAAARWPSLHLDADLGTIGRDTSALDRTYARRGAGARAGVRGRRDARPRAAGPGGAAHPRGRARRPDRQHPLRRVGGAARRAGRGRRRRSRGQRAHAVAAADPVRPPPGRP